MNWGTSLKPMCLSSEEPRKNTVAIIPTLNIFLPLVFSLNKLTTAALIILTNFWCTLLFPNCLWGSFLLFKSLFYRNRRYWMDSVFFNFMKISSSFSSYIRTGKDICSYFHTCAVVHKLKLNLSCKATLIFIFTSSHQKAVSKLGRYPLRKKQPARES